MKLFQAKVKWQNYTRQYAFGVVEAAPKFRGVPEKWPIRSRETMSPPYSRTVECNLRYAQKISKENYNHKPLPSITDVSDVVEISLAPRLRLGRLVCPAYLVNVPANQNAGMSSQRRSAQ